MLVLSRNVGEKILISGEILVQIVEIKADKVKIGISAPRDVNIMREEILTERERKRFLNEI